MEDSRMKKLWAAAIVFLVAVIIVGGVIIKNRLSSTQPIEISLLNPAKAGEQSNPGLGSIYVGGAIASPGWYQLKSSDTIPDLIQTAGGISDGADSGKIELRVPLAADAKTSQKVDINRADSWLLEALPEIGKTLAQRIIEYRQKNGPYHSIDEILKVPGIGTAVYDKIKNLITVADF